MVGRYLICLLPYVLLSTTTASNCPTTALSEWKTKDLNCTQDSTKRYHCQSDAGTNLKVEFCASPVDCTTGNRAQLDESTKTVSCVPCSREMYQLTSKPSYEFIQPNCDYRKTPCKLELGELQCGAATSSQNYQCKCDYTKGFKPNIIEKECECFAKDSSKCQCVEANCIEGEVLAANFSCVPSLVSNQGLSGGTLIGVIVGAIVGVIALIAIVAVVIYFVVIRRRKELPLNKAPEERTERTVPLIKVQEENDGKDTSPESPLVSKEGGDKEPERTGSLSEASPETPLMPAEGEQMVPERPEDNLYNKVKVMFVESVNPNDLVYRVNLNSNEEERITEHTKREGREAGAGLLLQTVKRVFPDDWFERIIPALKEPNVGLEHLAEKMEQIKQEK